VAEAGIQLAVLSIFDFNMGSIFLLVFFLDKLHDKQPMKTKAYIYVRKFLQKLEPFSFHKNTC